LLGCELVDEDGHGGAVHAHTGSLEKSRHEEGHLVLDHQGEPEDQGNRVDHQKRVFSREPSVEEGAAEGPDTCSDGDAGHQQPVGGGLGQSDAVYPHEVVLEVDRAEIGQTVSEVKR